jgi:polysaccharide pyruvyl transferase WcaK-like protein
VYGWYHQLNIGDDLFMQAFQKLFPQYHFIFKDTINAQDLQNVDAVFFGGGSFLLDQPRIAKDAYDGLLTKRIFYIGVGVETNVHPTHITLLKRACLIATRSLDQVGRLKALNPNVMWIPDLVYALQDQVQSSEVRDPRAVLIMPNVSVLPQTFDPYWKHMAWQHFKSEFAQFSDWLIENEYQPFFMSLCRATELDDDWVCSEIIGHMAHRNKYYLIDKQTSGIEQTTSLISKFGFIITQRFHGIVLAEMTRTPYISIYHHDKLKVATPGEGKIVSYHNTSKHSLISAFDDMKMMKFSSTLPIESNIFEELVQRVIGLVENGSLCGS